MHNINSWRVSGGQESLVGEAAGFDAKEDISLLRTRNLGDVSSSKSGFNLYMINLLCSLGIELEIS